MLLLLNEIPLHTNTNQWVTLYIIYVYILFHKTKEEKRKRKNARYCGYKRLNNGSEKEEDLDNTKRYNVWKYEETYQECKEEFRRKYYRNVYDILHTNFTSFTVMVDYLSHAMRNLTAISL